MGRHQFVYLLPLCCVLLVSLTGCWLTPRASTAPRIVVSPTGQATQAELDTLTRQNSELKQTAATRAELAQRAAGAIYGAQNANTFNPVGLPKQAVETQLEEAASAGPAPTTEQRLAKELENSRILAGELTAVRAEMGLAISENLLLRTSLTAGEQRILVLEGEVASTKKAGEAERFAAAANLQKQINELTGQITDARAETAKLLDAERKKMLRYLAWVLLGLGVIGALIAGATLYLSKGMEWQRAAIAGLVSSAAFSLYWTVNQEWFKYLVWVFAAVVAGAVVWFLYREATERKQREGLTTRTVEADEAEDTLMRIIESVDSLGDAATVAQVRSAMSVRMGDNNKALIHELRAETKRKSNP